MKAIAGGNLAGFPNHLITVYVECEIIGEKADLTVLDYIMSDPKVISAGAEEVAVRKVCDCSRFICLRKVTSTQSHAISNKFINYMLYVNCYFINDYFYYDDLADVD